MTVWRAALVGAGEGALIGALIALLFGLFSGPDFGELLLFSLAVGAFFGGITGAIIQAASGEGRFASTMTVATDRYEVQVEEDAADEATTVGPMPAGDGARAAKAVPEHHRRRPAGRGRRRWAWSLELWRRTRSRGQVTTAR